MYLGPLHYHGLNSCKVYFFFHLFLVNVNTFKITAMIIAITHLINIHVCFLVKGKPYYDVLKLLAII